MEFIYQIDNHLPKDLCEKMIEKFDNDPNVVKSSVGNGDGSNVNNRVDDQIRKSDILHITGMKEWDEIDVLLHKNLEDGMKKYKTYLENLVGVDKVVEHVFQSIKIDSGYDIQRMKKNDFYTWHIDEFLNCNTNTQRVVTAMWYLNTLDEDDGGVTEFWMKKGIRPKQGTLLFFPSNWNYIHRGGIVKNDVTKYTCITWLINTTTK